MKNQTDGAAKPREFQVGDQVEHISGFKQKATIVAIDATGIRIRFADGHTMGPFQPADFQESIKVCRQVEIGGVNQYIFAHGKRPSGQGTWAFRGADGTIKFINGTYSQAKKQALRTIRNPVLQP